MVMMIFNVCRQPLADLNCLVDMRHNFDIQQDSLLKKLDLSYDYNSVM
jgi:hypothetical protein